MACPGCGAETQPNQKFCHECGESLARTCPSCATPYEGSPRFCAECGTALRPAAIPLAAEAVAEPGPEANGGGPVAERRLVSVLFADLVGFTTLAEGRDAEAVREQLTRYFEVAQEIVVRYGGTVEKFIGDAVMAVWGTPVSHEDDAERAVRAALDLLDAVSRMGTEERALQARAGVLTGEAAVTLGATNQGMVAGDLVNTASRLQSAAPPGTVLVGEETFRSASRAIAFEPVDDQELKGKASPVPAYRALRVVAQRGGAGRVEALEAPFLGRDPEHRLLKDLFHATSGERRPRLVSVIGQAGIGKGRLVKEFENYIDGIKQRVLWHQGRSPAYGEGISFWALGEMVRSRVGLLELDDNTTTKIKLTGYLETILHDEAERRWMQPKLEQLLGVAESDTGGRDELFAAWRTFFERVAGDQTAVLVFEDLHWADPGQLDFIEHILEWSRGTSLLVVTMARPELLDRRPSWGARQRSFTSIALEPLPDDVIREILRSLVPGLPPGVADQITARAEGIPLYAIETVRMLLQDGRLEAVDGTFRPVGDLTSLAVPATLHALIAARLDAVDGADRMLLQQASVLGQTFAIGALAAIAGRDDDLEGRLRELVRRELLTLEMDTRSPEHGQYGFVQALVRDVAYNTLARRDRKMVHLAAGQYFESLSDDEIVDATAMHYLDAYRSAPEDPDAGPIRTHAAELLQRAAMRAMALGSHDQAVRFLELALEVTGQPAEQSRILLRAGTAAGLAGRYEVAEAFLRRAVDAARPAGDLSAEARAFASLGQLLASAGRPALATTEIGAVLDRFGAVDDESRVLLWTALARAHMLHNDFAPAVEWADRALPIAERLDMISEIADLLNTRATALTFGGRLREGIAGLRGALQLGVDYDMTYAAIRARINLSSALSTEDSRAGWELASAGIAEAKRTGHINMLATLGANAASNALLTGDWAAASETMAELLALDLAPTDRYVLSTISIILDVLAGRPHADALEESEAFAQTTDEPVLTGQLEATRGWIALVEGRYPEAFESAMRSAVISAANTAADLPVAARAALWAGDVPRAQQALDALVAAGIHGRVVHAYVHTFDAGVKALRGEMDEAAASYHEVVREWRDLGAWFELAMSQLDFVRLVGGERPEVRAAADEARLIFERIGARWLVAHLDAALGLPAAT
ncbi:MAG: adenylate/guanylate cyclase domain-containing protein [Candidatus Limnocylindria bacterium]